jgi:heme oxygenase
MPAPTALPTTTPTRATTAVAIAAPTIVPPSAPTLAERLRAETRDLHAVAERAGVMRELLAGRLPLAGYAALLCSLHSIYVALERALDARRSDPRVAPLRRPGLYRTAALAADLAALHDADWTESLRPAPPAVAYGERIGRLAAEGSPALAAHAYVRYLGDLHGGQVLAALVRRRFALDGAAGTAFYRFGDEACVMAHRQALREALAALPLTGAEADAVVAEARWAFEQHVRLFEALAAGAMPAR